MTMSNEFEDAEALERLKHSKKDKNQSVVVVLQAITSEYVSPVDDLIRRHLPPALELFRSKSRDYSERSGIFTADLLGAKGQFAEIWRKIPKLKKGMWDGEELKNEVVEEILYDILGHVLLALDMIPAEMRMPSQSSHAHLNLESLKEFQEQIKREGPTSADDKLAGGPW